MLKRILTIIMTVVTVASALLVPINASAFGNVGEEKLASSSSGMDYAYPVKGGIVKNVDELIAAFTDTREGKEGKVYARAVAGKENTVELTADVILKAPIQITEGVYKLLGRHATVYRGFEGVGCMIEIVGLGNKASGLILENEDTGEWSTPLLTLDGNRAQYPFSPLGIITMKGRTSLTVNKGVLMTGASSVTYGGAIFAEIDEFGTERTPLIPTVKLDNCRIENCHSEAGGGAVALVGYYSGTNDGELSLKNVTLKNNTANGSELYGKGGAIYSVGGTLALENVNMENNVAHFGGAVYTESDTVVKNSTVSYNKALIEGGAIACGAREGIKSSVLLSDCTVTYNVSEGSGGALANDGLVELKGMTLLMNNEAAAFGGAVFNKGELTLSGGSLTSNKAGAVGGGIYSAGKLSKIVMNDAELGNNDAAHVSALYCEGIFEMYDGAIGNSKGKAPHILLKQDLVIGGSAFVTNDTIGFCVTDTEDGKYYPCVIIASKMSAAVPLKVGYYKEKFDSDGALKKLAPATKNGIFAFAGNNAEVSRASEIFEIENRGLFSYRIKDGELSVRFIFLAVWVWVLFIAASLGVTGFLFRKKLIPMVKRIVKK